MSLLITKPDDSLLGALSLTIERGVPSDHVAVKIKNDGITPVAGAFVTLYAELIPGSGNYGTEGHPIVDEIMGRFQITGQDSTATPGQFVDVGIVQPMGHAAQAQLPTILPGDWILADLWLEQNSTSAAGGTANLKIEIAGDEAARPVPQGLTVAVSGVDSGVNQPENFLISGREILPTGTPDDTVHVQVGSWLLGGVEYSDASIEDLTFNQNDGNGDALVSGETYIVLVTQGAASVPNTYKGVKDVTGASVAPAATTGELVLGYLTIRYGLLGTTISSTEIEQDLTFGRLLVTAPATGLTAVVHAGLALTANFLLVHGQKETVTLTDSATNRIWIEASGAITVTTSATQPSAGALLLATAVTSGGNVTTLTDTRSFIGTSGALAPHASTHASGGTDPVSPASIGAASTADLALKADLADPALTGVPTAPTATAGDDSTQIATTAFVQTELTNVLGEHVYEFPGDGSSQPTALSPVPAAGTIPDVFVDGLRKREDTPGGAKDYKRTGTDLENIVFTPVLATGGPIAVIKWRG